MAYVEAGAPAGHTSSPSSSATSLPVTPPMQLDDEQWAGWAISELAQLARTVANKRPSRILDYEERCDIGMLAIIEALYTSAEPPTRYDLLNAAGDTLSVILRRELAVRGLAFGTSNTGARFGAYWYGSIRSITPMEDRLIEHIALYEVLPVLSPRHREVLTTVARHWGDRTAAAHELGITRMALMVHLSRARAEFRWFWFWPESPPRHWGRDRKCTTEIRHQDGSNRAMVSVRRGRGKVALCPAPTRRRSEDRRKARLPAARAPQGHRHRQTGGRERRCKRLG
jgi:hypothetical protein